MRSHDESGNDRLFNALPLPMRSLARRGVVRRYGRNTVVANEDEPCDFMVVVLEGRIRLFSNDPDGHEITYETVGPGECFGESCLDGGPRLASGITLQGATCSIVTRQSLREHLLADPAHALSFIEGMVGRGRKLSTRLRELALKDVYGRVVSALEAHHGSGRPDAPICLAPLTHQTIASRIGASREMVSRLLKDLERGGYVQLGVKQITLVRKLPARW